MLVLQTFRHTRYFAAIEDIRESSGGFSYGEVWARTLGEASQAAIQAASEMLGPGSALVGAEVRFWFPEDVAKVDFLVVVP